MYDEKESNSKIDWKPILKRVLILVAILIVILCIIGLVRSCSSNKKTNNDTKVVESKAREDSVKNALDGMQEAILKYTTPDIMPRLTGEVTTVRLDYLIKENYATSLKSDNGKVCNREKTYGVITKLNSNYELKIYANCGNTSDSKTIYIGCFSSCKNGVCVGGSADEGVCSTVNTSSSNGASSTKTNANTNANTSNSNKQTTTTPKVDNTPKTTYYEYKTYTNSYTCPNGGNLNGTKCEVSKPAKYAGIVQGKGLTYTCDTGELKDKKCITSYDATLTKSYTGTIWSANANLGSGYEKTGNTK